MDDRELVATILTSPDTASLSPVGNGLSREYSTIAAPTASLWVFPAAGLNAARSRSPPSQPADFRTCHTPASRPNPAPRSRHHISPPSRWSNSDPAADCNLTRLPAIVPLNQWICLLTTSTPDTRKWHNYYILDALPKI